MTDICDKAESARQQGVLEPNILYNRNHQAIKLRTRGHVSY